MIDKKEPNIKIPYNIAKLSPIFNNLIHKMPEQKYKKIIIGINNNDLLLSANIYLVNICAIPMIMPAINAKNEFIII